MSDEPLKFVIHWVFPRSQYILFIIFYSSKGINFTSKIQVTINNNIKDKSTLLKREPRAYVCFTSAFERIEVTTILSISPFQYTCLVFSVVGLEYVRQSGELTE